MSIKKFYYKVQETSTTTGNGGLTLAGATTSNQRFLDTIGNDTDFTYRIINADNTLEWEMGIGSVDNSSVSAGVLVRTQVIASSNGNSAVSFTVGTKNIDLIETDANITNTQSVSTTTTVPYLTASYIVDASSGNLVINLPSIATGFGSASNTQSVIVSVVLNSTTGNATEQTDAVTITPDGADTVGGGSTYVLSILNDFIQIVADPGNNNWVVLDPIQDSVYPSGGNGAIQFSSNQGFAYSSGLYWNSASDSLLIGSSGVGTASVQISSTGNNTFNIQKNDADFYINTVNQDKTFSVDASTDRIGIGTSSPTKKLDISVSGTDGVRVTSVDSASVPSIFIENNYTGLNNGDDLGALVFKSLDSTSNITDYGKILVEFSSNTDGSEAGVVKVQATKNGTLQTVAQFAYDETTIGNDNSNTNGLVIGEQNVNTGQNVVVGYSIETNGSNAIGLGNDNIISSTFGAGAFGVNQNVSGDNTWLFGGSGITLNTDNSTVLATDNDNYIQVMPSGKIELKGVADSLDVDLVNSTVVSSTGQNNLSFVYYNSTGQAKDGVVISNKILSSTNGSENTALGITTNIDGGDTSVIYISKEALSVGTNTGTDGNTTIGLGNTVTSTGNIVVGESIVVTGSNNLVFGAENTLVDATGNVSVLGVSNDINSSGNHDILVVGNSNVVDEDFSVTLGLSNTNSGLYSTTIGFDNGASGAYTTNIGSNNTVLNTSSVAVGNNNQVNGGGVNSQGFALGVGNTVTPAKTGVAVGLNNTILGDSAYVFGSANSSSGANNTIIGNDNAVTGSNIVVIGSGQNYTASNSTYISNGNGSVQVTNTGVNVVGTFSVGGSGLLDIISANGGGGGGGVSANNGSVTVTGANGLTGHGTFTVNQSSNTTVQLEFDNSSDLDMNGNRVLFSNVYSALGDLPSATNNHGMFAHVHAEAAAYYAHAGNWVKLANYSDIGGGGGGSSITDGTSTLDFDSSNNLRVDTHLLPSGDATYDLGSSSKKWRDLYLDGNSIHIGDAEIRSTGTDEICLPAVSLSGHIIPTSNAQYDLGNAEYKIRHLFLSDNSMYVGDNTVRFAGTEMLVNDEPLSSYSSNIAKGVNHFPTNSITELTFNLENNKIQTGQSASVDSLLFIYDGTTMSGCMMQCPDFNIVDYDIPEQPLNNRAFLNIPVSYGPMLTEVSNVSLTIQYTGAVPHNAIAPFTGIMVGNIIAG